MKFLLPIPIELKEKWLYHDPSPHCYHWVNDPIPEEHLRLILNSLLPPKDSIKTTKNWDKKIDELVGFYLSYVYTVCGEASSEGSSAGGQGHTVKWDLFQKELERWRSLGFHNSLQYENEKNNNGLTMTKKNGKIDEIENWVWVVYKGFLVSSTLS